MKNIFQKIVGKLRFPKERSESDHGTFHRIGDGLACAALIVCGVVGWILLFQHAPILLR
jgi:hypothetical protein